jgi:hypothetical protein
VQRWVPPLLIAALVIGLVYLRTVASFEELGELAPMTPKENAPAAEVMLEPGPASLHETAATGSTSSRGAVEPLAPEERSPPLRGRVLTPEGEPYGWATVRFATVRRGRAELQQTLTREDGCFELVPEVRAARGDLLVTAKSHEFSPVALLDVAAGSEELELRLAPPQTFVVRFIDAQGMEHEPHELSFHWMLAGVTREDEEKALGKLRWIRSPVPFRIHVNDPELQDAWLGPFEPNAVDDELVVTVRRRAFVRGVVLAGGAPVQGANVRMEPVEDAAGTRGWAFGNGLTDERGEFWFRVMATGTFRPIAFHARGLGSLVHCDGERDLGGLTLELDEPPGWIEGRILLPEGRSTALCALQLDQRYRTPRADGSFLLPDVEPGTHVLRLVAGEPSDPRDCVTLRRGSTVPGFTYTPSVPVEVRSGAGSTVVIDLSAPRAVRLEGHIDLGRRIDDASSFGSHEPVGVTFWREDGAGHETQAILARQGESGATFAAEFDAPGRRMLEFQLMLGEFATEGTWRVRDALDLSEGIQSWELALTPGALRLYAPDVELELEPEPILRWRGGGELTIETPGFLSGMVERAPGSVLYHAVPPGRVTFQLVPDGATYEVTVRAGETSEFVFPESAREELRAAYDMCAKGVQTPSYLQENGYY